MGGRRGASDGPAKITSNAAESTHSALFRVGKLRRRVGVQRRTAILIGFTSRAVLVFLRESLSFFLHLCEAQCLGRCPEEPRKITSTPLAVSRTAPAVYRLYPGGF